MISSIGKYLPVLCLVVHILILSKYDKEGGLIIVTWFTEGWQRFKFDPFEGSKYGNDDICVIADVNTTPSIVTIH